MADGPPPMAARAFDALMDSRRTIRNPRQKYEYYYQQTPFAIGPGGGNRILTAQREPLVGYGGKMWRIGMTSYTSNMFAARSKLAVIIDDPPKSGGRNYPRLLHTDMYCILAGAIPGDYLTFRAPDKLAIVDPFEIVFEVIRD